MPLLAETVALAVIIRTLVYVLARLKANPKTADMAPMIVDPLAVLHGTVAARIKADNHALETAARRDYAAEQVTDLLVPLGQRLAAAYGGDRTHPGYVRVFARAPSELAATPNKDQVQVFGKLLHALQDAETPAELAPHVAEFAARCQHLVAEDKADREADLDLGKAVKGVAKARTGALDAIAQVQGELQKRFPRDSKRMRRFFPPVARVKAEPAPEPQPGDDVGPK